jgi:hypothetical protein
MDRIWKEGQRHHQQEQTFGSRHCRFDWLECHFAYILNFQAAVAASTQPETRRRMASRKPLRQTPVERNESSLLCLTVQNPVITDFVNAPFTVGKNPIVFSIPKLISFFRLLLAFIY